MNPWPIGARGCENISNSIFSESLAFFLGAIRERAKKENDERCQLEVKLEDVLLWFLWLSGLALAQIDPMHQINLDDTYVFATYTCLLEVSRNCFGFEIMSVRFGSFQFVFSL